MRASAPPTRRKFADTWDQIRYLHAKLLYWLYDRGNLRGARKYAARLQRLLQKTTAGKGSILREECKSLLSEAKGDLAGAIKHRENEIGLIRRLHELSATIPQRDFVLGQYGYDDLADRLDLLAILYHDAGDIDRAVEVLEESKRLCAAHRVPFDGQDVLGEYLAEQKRALPPDEAEAPSRSRRQHARRHRAG